MLELRVLIYAIILTAINNTAAQSAHNAEHFNDTTTGFKTTTTTTDLSQTVTTTINSIDLSSTTNNNS